MARRKSGGVEETYNVLWQPSGHFAWICGATQEGSNKAKHEKAETEANIWASIGDSTGSLALTTGSH